MPSSALAQGPALPAITELDQFWAANQDEVVRDLSHPVDLTVTVLYYDPEWQILYLDQNGSGNFLPSTPEKLPFVAGDRVSIRGSMLPKQGLSASRLAVERLESDALYEALSLPHSMEGYNAFHMKLARVSGYIDRKSYEDPTHTHYDLIAGGLRISFQKKFPPSQPVPEIVGKFVSVEGVFVVTASSDQKPASLSLWADLEMKVELATQFEEELRASELTPVAALRDAEPQALAKVAGLVYSHHSGEQLVLRDETGQMTVATVQTRPLQQGDAVEVIGTPVKEGAAWTLRNALVVPLDDSDSAAASNLSRELLFQYRLAEQVISIDPDQRDAGHSAILNGVITFVDPHGAYLYLQDNSGGVLVRTGDALDRPAQAGEAAAVRGVIATGPFAPIVQAREITIAGTLDFPNPKRLAYDQAISGHEDGQWVEISGYLEKHEYDGLWTYLILSTAHGEFEAKALSPSGPCDVDIGATLRLRGVLSTLADEDRKLESTVMLVTSQEHIVVEIPALEDPFSLPLSPIAELQRYKPYNSAYQQILVRGVVTHYEPGKSLFISNGDDSLKILNRSHHDLAPGDAVELVGLPKRAGQTVRLRNSALRKIGVGEQPSPLVLERDHPKLDPKLDGQLVTFVGYLLDTSVSGDKIRLALQSQEQFLVAAGPANSIANEWQTDSLLALTGVYSISFDDYGDPDEATILLRDSADIAVLEPAPWWNPKRAFFIAAICAAALLVGGFWSMQLRKRVAAQTKLIREQVERESLLETQHREIVGSASDFIFTFDFDGRFTSFNEAGKRITGWTSEEAKAIRVFDLLSERQAKRVIAALRRARGTRNVVFETQIRRKDRSELWVEVTAGFLRRDGEAICAFGVIHDIHDRKQVEEELKRARDAAEENTRAKSAFLATMSHELRTPMNGIIGMTDLLLDLQLEDSARDFAETIRDSASALLVLLNDILDLSKAEAGKLTIDPHPFSLQEAVAQTLTLLETTAHAKRLELLCALPESLPPQLIGDAGRLRQVILNLVGNAIKFTPEGHVSLSVTIESESDRDLTLLFEIKDTGIGIPAKAKAHLFQPFVQADASHSRRFGGTGLGLKISQEIVTLLRGDIGNVSEEGKGSIFWFTARFDKIQQSVSERAQAPQAKKLVWNGPPIKILVAEDMPVNQRVTRLQLKKMGFDSDLVSNGIEVLDAVREKSYHLIFMDCQMPEMDGLEATTRLRADPANDAIHIVALTANAMASDRERCLEIGMNDYVSKPTRADKLYASIEDYARKAQLID